MSGIGLHYKVEGSGKAVVFVHGLSDNLNYWEVLASTLKKEYLVIRYDLPGHGQSELGDGEITIDSYVEDLANLLDELNVDNFNLIGFSLGGVIAMDFAIKYPEKVDSLVLMSTFSKFDDHLRKVFTDFKNALNIGFEEFYDLILPMVLCPKVIEDNRDELEFLKSLAMQNANVQAYIKAVGACYDFDAEDELPKIDIPAMVLAGKYDEITTVDIQRKIHEKIDGSEFIIFDDVKHNLLVGKNNEKILELLNDFLKNKR